MNQPSILVVDDQPRNFDVLESLLSSQNYELHYASSGQEALESLELIPLDLILLDVMMPEMDGIEVCSRIKANPQWQSIPIIMVTALTEKEDLALCLSAGADDFLSKPVNGLELRARVHSMLRIKQQYDNLQTLLKLREDLVKMLVHDLRNPLAGILLGLEMLTYPKLSPEAKQEKIVKIKLSGQKLSGLIDDLLLMARIESGKIALNLSPVDLGNMLRKLVKDFEFNASQKKIEIITQIPDFDGTIKIDQAMFQRVLDNLLSNSIKFSPQESQIIVSAEHLPEGGTKIKIADYGQGVPDNLKQCIFEKYEIGTLMQGVSQIGLGLAFCKMIVEAHGGTIIVENNQPQGAIFEITLPNNIT